MIDEFLPLEVAAAIQSHYRKAVVAAEANYRSSEADEDSVTGALGQAMITRRKRSVVVGGVTYRWKTEYTKFRGRGPGAVEKQLGADGVFEMEVQDADGSTLGRKSLLFQAKNQWTGTNRKLLEQSSQLAEIPRGCVVIDYTPRGYFGIPVEAVLEAEGDRRRLAGDAVRSLGELLADSFVPCFVGRRDLYYDANRRQLLFFIERVGVRTERLALRHRVKTSIERERGRYLVFM